jgi:hypothetical protein
MSKNAGRMKRWARQDARTYSSNLGQVAYQQDAWYGLLEYQTLGPPQGPGGPPAWQAHRQRLGPFRRPRDAMVALEREATFLRNRHGKAALIGDQLWAEI